MHAGFAEFGRRYHDAQSLFDRPARVSRLRLTGGIPYSWTAPKSCFRIDRNLKSEGLHMSSEVRKVLLVGSVPLKPAAAVFGCAAEHLSGLLPRMPDGEQSGWLLGVLRQIAGNPALEPSRQVHVVRNRPTIEIFRRPFQYYRLRDGYSASEISLGSYGVAENAIQSYQTFKEMKDAGSIPVGTRFQATAPGPLDCVFTIDMPDEQLFPLAEKALARELDEIVAAIPANDLTIQIDLAVEVEMEEYRRRPSDFDMPVYETLDRTLDQQADLVAAIANRVPTAVELGFHLCSIWHIDQSRGQDNNVHVDWCNALSERIPRPIAYIHMPTVPEHDAADFALLRRLRLHPETKLYLGVIHAHDGIEGARRRIKAAETAISGFGIGAFCGLAQPSTEEEAHPHSVAQIFQLHRAAAHS